MPESPTDSEEAAKFAAEVERIRSSGQWTGKVRMSKRGSRALRTAIWRASGPTMSCKRRRW